MYLHINYCNRWLQSSDIKQQYEIPGTVHKVLFFRHMHHPGSLHYTSSESTHIGLQFKVWCTFV